MQLLTMASWAIIHNKICYNVEKDNYSLSHAEDSKHEQDASQLHKYHSPHSKPFEFLLNDHDNSINYTNCMLQCIMGSKTCITCSSFVQQLVFQVDLLVHTGVEPCNLLGGISFSKSVVFSCLGSGFRSFFPKIWMEPFVILSSKTGFV